MLGIDRDSGTIAGLFDEENDAVKQMIAEAIAAARRSNKPIGICGQAPSDRPQFADWLVSQGIDSISLNADSVIRVRRNIRNDEDGFESVITTKRQDRHRFLLSLCFLCVSFSSTGFLGRDRRIAELHHTAWTAKDGAPRQISALAQTEDGYLWIGSASPRSNTDEAGRHANRGRLRLFISGL